MVKRGDEIKYFRNVLMVTAVAIVSCLTSLSTYALSGSLLNNYAQNDVLFYDPGIDENTCIGNGADVAVCGASLPEETIKSLENAKVKEKSEQNIERYKYAEEKTGVPWQAVAALHWREASMRSDATIFNGQKLSKSGCYTNVDGQLVCSDANEDAAAAAQHFIDNAKSIYGVDVLSDKSMEAYGQAFLAYNRGNMYKCKNRSYTESPYVMNGFDKDHIGMVWIDADTTFCNNRTANSIKPGSRDGNTIGAMSVMAYLCGGSSSSSETPESVSGAGKTCATYDGDYPSYMQSDTSKPWSGYGYGAGKTISSSGCGAASMAMLITYAIGQDVYPQDVADATSSSGYYWGTSGSGMTNLDKIACEKYGCEAVDVPYSSKSDAINKLEQYLKEGYVIHISGAGSLPFTPGGHYVGLAGYNDGKTMVLNSAREGNKEYSVRDVVYNGLHGGSFSAIRGKGASKCSNLCSDANSVEGGLTEEQAQKLADYYNGDKVSVSEYGLPKGKKNCVSFSAFFVQHFTNVGVIGRATWTTPETHYGASSMVSVLKNNYGFQTGTEVKPYTIFSVTWGDAVCGSAKCGHTGVIVGVDGDKVITIEAALNKHDAKVFTRTKNEFVNTISDPFAYTDGKDLNSAEMAKIVGN